MPRKASTRKAGKKSTRKQAPSAAERQAATESGKAIPDVATGPEQDLRQAKNANPAHVAKSEETARLNAAAQTRPNANGEADSKRQARAALADTDALRKVQATQGPDGHPIGEGTRGEKPDLGKAVLKVKGEGILREELVPPKPEQRHVVQQGGGGVVSASGDAIR